MPPIQAADAQTACGAKGAGLELEKDHIVNAGAAWIPISAIMYVRIITPVHIPPTGVSLPSPRSTELRQGSRSKRCSHRR